MDSKFNRNYKVIWNRALGQWVVASERSNPFGKGKVRTAAQVLGTVLVAGGLMFGAPGEARALSGTGGAATVCTGKAATISVQASNTSIAAVWLHGLLPAGIDGTLSNAGSISAQATNALSGSATAYGILSWGGISGTLTNSGSITATVSNNPAVTTTNSVTAYGLYIWDMQGGTVNNSGTVTATASGQGAKAYAVYQGWAAGTSGGAINNLAGGQLIGSIWVNDPYTNVTNAGTIALPNNGVANRIAGNYTQQAGGVLAVDVYSKASYAKLAVGKTADVSNSCALKVTVDPANTLAVGDVLPGVLTATTFVGCPSYTVTDNSSAFDFTAATNLAGTGIDLTVVKAAATLAGGGGGGCLADTPTRTGIMGLLALALLGLGRMLGLRRREDAAL